MAIGRSQNVNKNLLDIQEKLKSLKNKNGRIEKISFKLENGEVHVEKRTFGVFHDVLHLFGQDQDPFKEIQLLFKTITIDDVLGNKKLEKSVDTLKKICSSILQERYFLKEEEKKQLQDTITHLEEVQQEVERVKLLRNIPRAEDSIEKKVAFLDKAYAILPVEQTAVYFLHFIGQGSAKELVQWVKEQEIGTPKQEKKLQAFVENAFTVEFLNKAYAILPVEQTAVYYLHFIEQENAEELVQWIKEQEIETPEQFKKLQAFVKSAFTATSDDTILLNSILEKVIGSSASLLEKPNGLRMLTYLFSVLDAIRGKAHISKNIPFFEVQKKVLEQKLQNRECDYTELGKDFIRCVAAVYPHQYDKIMDIIHKTILPSLDLKNSKEFLKGIRGYISENTVVKNARLFEEYIADIVQSIEHGETSLFSDIEVIKNKIRRELLQKPPNYQKIGKHFSDMEALDVKQIAKKNLERFLYTEIAGFLEDAILHRKESMSSDDMKSFIHGLKKNSTYRKHAEEIHDRLVFFKENREDTISLSVLTHDLFTHPNKFKNDREEYQRVRQKNERTDPEQYTKDVHREDIFINEQLCPENDQKEQFVAQNLERVLGQVVSKQNIPWVTYQVQQLFSQSILSAALFYTVGTGASAKQMQDVLEFTVACSVFENRLVIKSLIGMKYHDTQQLQKDQFAVGIELGFDLTKMNTDDFLYTEGCCSSCVITRFGAKNQDEVENLFDEIKAHGFHFKKSQDNEEV